ncbi:hypothetical protein N8773_01120 [Candidatus Pseudothioglobus singularis]|nr:hypothetical protein [Candidatus Pseudothioglobus singularis]
MHLNEVTLVCFDTRNIDAAIESMRLSLAQISFNKNILFTSESLCSKEHLSKVKNLNIKLEFIDDVQSITDYSHFILVRLNEYIHTNYCLVTQWDGWVINKDFWDSNFLKFDYIGAVWPHHDDNKIGNGGFSLRSKKLLKSTKLMVQNEVNLPSNLIEDDYICREKRLTLENEYQVKFPSDEIANKFSVEGNGIPNKSFGFHGMDNFNVVMKEEALINFINKLENNHFTNRASYDLAKKLILEGRFEIAKLIIKKRLISNGINKKHLKLLLLLKIKNISLS